MSVAAATLGADIRTKAWFVRMLRTLDAFNRHLSIGQRFVIITICFSIPFLVFVPLYLSHAVDDVRFIDAEISGVRDLMALRTHLVASVRDQIEAQRAGQASGASEPSLAPGQVGPAGSPNAARVDADIHAMREIGDRSNISLDTYLDTYYLGHAAVVAVPTLVGSISSSSTPSKGADPQVARARIALFVSELTSDLNRAIPNDPTGGSATVLAPKVSELLAASKRYQRALTSEARSGPALDAAALDLLDRSDVVWRAAAERMRLLLVDHADRLKRQAVYGLSGLSLCLLLGLGLAWSVSRALTRRLSVLMTVMDDLIDGDGEARVPFQDDRNETGKIASTLEHLKRVQKEAAAASIAKTEFLANMSHEIRTPLASIIGYSALIGDYVIPKDCRMYAEKVSNASKILLATVNDILDYTKFESGSIALSLRAADPIGIVDGIIEMMGIQADAKLIGLSRDPLASAPRVVVDPGRVRQILTNLIGNAVKLTDSGRIDVAIAYDSVSQRLRYIVDDTGPGLSDEDCSRLFHRFSQTTDSVDRGKGGTGLGLAICKMLTTAMGGEIGVTSQLGRGSSFWFEIPAPLATMEPDGVDHARQALVSHDLDGIRLLVIDASEAVLGHCRQVTEHLGCELFTASNLSDALAVVNHHLLDLVLIGPLSEELNYTVLIRAIRETDGFNQFIPIAAFENAIAPEQRGCPTELGIERLLKNPLQPEEFSEAIHEIILSPSAT